MGIFATCSLLFFCCCNSLLTLMLLLIFFGVISLVIVVVVVAHFDTDAVVNCFCCYLREKVMFSLVLVCLFVGLLVCLLSHNSKSY